MVQYTTGDNFRSPFEQKGFGLFFFCFVLSFLFVMVAFIGSFCCCCFGWIFFFFVILLIFELVLKEDATLIGDGIYLTGSHSPKKQCWFLQLIADFLIYFGKQSHVYLGDRDSECICIEIGQQQQKIKLRHLKISSNIYVLCYQTFQIDAEGNTPEIIEKEKKYAITSFLISRMFIASFLFLMNQN